MENRPWAEWKASKVASPKPITKNQLAQLLKPFHIISDSVRIDDEHTPKGYYLQQFAEAFDRYLATEGVSETQQRNKPTAAGTNTTFRNATSIPDVAFRKCEKPAPDAACCGVADQKGGNGLAGASGKPWPRVCEHCGAHERTDTPLQAYEVDGVTYWLHPHCQQDWLAAPDPNGWTFNLET